MNKLTTSAIGILLLNPLSCSGSDGGNGDGLGGGSTGIGGSGAVVRCNVATGAECLPNQFCKQTLFPILPPAGTHNGGGATLLGECVMTGQGGSSSTGGSTAMMYPIMPPSTGGKSATGGSTAVMYPILPPSTGGKSATGGSTAVMYPILPPSTGGKSATGGSTAVMYPILPYGARNDAITQTPQSQTTTIDESDSWRQTAEAALRRV